MQSDFENSQTLNQSLNENMLLNLTIPKHCTVNLDPASPAVAQGVHTAACLWEVGRPLPAERVQPTQAAYQQAAAPCPDPSPGTSQGSLGPALLRLNNSQGEPQEKPHHAQYGHSLVLNNTGCTLFHTQKWCAETRACHRRLLSKEQKSSRDRWKLLASLHLSQRAEATEATELLQG